MTNSLLHYHKQLFLDDVQCVFYELFVDVLFVDLHADLIKELNKKMESSSAVTAKSSCSNSATQHLGKEDDVDVVQAHTRKVFRIDTSKIESVPHCQQNAELQELDLHVYNQDTFEQGCLIDCFLCLHKEIVFHLH